MEEKKIKIKQFLGRFIRVRELADDSDIFASGLVNSLFAMQLVMFLEDEFCIKIENHELNLSNFKSVNAILAFLERKHLE